MRDTTRRHNNQPCEHFNIHLGRVLLCCWTWDCCVALSLPFPRQRHILLVFFTREHVVDCCHHYMSCCAFAMELKLSHAKRMGISELVPFWVSHLVTFGFALTSRALTDDGKTASHPFFLPNEAHHGDPRS